MTSRLRSRARRCHGTLAPPSAPIAMVACTSVDGAESIVPWARSLGSPTPHARIVTDPVLPWDLAATERHVAGLVAVDAIRRAEVARARLDALPVARYTSRAHVEPAPLRQVGVAGDLAAALAELDEREVVTEEVVDVEVAVGGRCDGALVWEEAPRVPPVARRIERRAEALALEVA